METKIKIGVCEGRHEIPDVQGYVFGQTVPSQLLTNPQELEILAAKKLGELVSQFGQDDCPIDLYATGLTVALIAIINAARLNGHPVTVYHYDRDCANYFAQPLA